MIIKKIYRRIWSILINTRIKYGKLYIFKIKLETNQHPKIKNKIELANSIEDLHEIIQERGNDFKKMYEKWLLKGYICFLSKNEKSTIGIVWLNNTNMVPLEFCYKQKLKNSSEAGLIDAYVLKEKRGKGVYKTIWNEALNEAQRLGIKTLYGYILNNNIRSIKVHFKLGMKDVYQILYYIRILWFNLYFKKKFRNLKDISLLKKFE